MPLHLGDLGASGKKGEGYPDSGYTSSESAVLEHVPSDGIGFWVCKSLFMYVFHW